MNPCKHTWKRVVKSGYVVGHECKECGYFSRSQLRETVAQMEARLKRWNELNPSFPPVDMS